MKILAIESATVTASCAVAEDEKVLGVYSLSHKLTHSEKLMPIIEHLLKDVAIDPKELNLIAVSEGPGSYTGLRIGAAIGKSLAYAWDIEVVGVPTMMSLASNIYSNDRLIVPILDAKSERVYSGIYKWDGNMIVSVKEQFPSDLAELTDIINNNGLPVVFNGDGSKIYKDKLQKEVKIDAVFAPEIFDILSASSVSNVGYMLWKQGKSMKPKYFAPDYLRLSQAERNKKI